MSDSDLMDCGLPDSSSGLQSWLKFMSTEMVFYRIGHGDIFFFPVVIVISQYT